MGLGLSVSHKYLSDILKAAFVFNLGHCQLSFEGLPASFGGQEWERSEVREGEADRGLQHRTVAHGQIFLEKGIR